MAEAGERLGLAGVPAELFFSSSSLSVSRCVELAAHHCIVAASFGPKSISSLVYNQDAYQKRHIPGPAPELEVPLVGVICPTPTTSK